MVRPGVAADLRAVLDKCGAKVPPRVLHGWTAVPAAADPLDPAEVERMADLGFYSLLTLAQEIDRRLPEEPVALFAVSANVQDVTGGEEVEPGKALLLGPARTINRELSNLACRSIDLSLPARVPAAVQAEQLLAECAQDSENIVVAWRGHQRWAWSFRNIRLDPPAGTPLALTDRGVYLVTGGLGGLGLTVARHLAERVKARLVLLGALAVRTARAVERPVGSRRHPGPATRTTHRTAGDRAGRRRGADLPGRRRRRVGTAPGGRADG